MIFRKSVKLFSPIRSSHAITTSDSALTATVMLPPECLAGTGTRLKLRIYLINRVGDFVPALLVSFSAKPESHK